MQQAVGDLAEGVQVLAEQEHGLGAHAFVGQELVRALADPLRQHHELADGGDLGRRGAALQLQGRHGLGRLEQVGRLAVDGAQRLSHLGQGLLLRQHDLRVLLGAIDQRHQRRDGVLHAGRNRAHQVVAGVQAAHVVGQHGAAFLDFREGGGAADHGLRDRLGQALRLHQRGTGGLHLLRVGVGRAEGEVAGSEQADDADGRQREHEALLVAHRAAADQRQAGVVLVDRHLLGLRRLRIEQARGRGIGVVGDQRRRVHRRRVDAFERQVDGQVVLGVHDAVLVLLARTDAVEREGRVAHRVDVEIQRRHRAAGGQRVRRVGLVAEAGAVVRVVQRLSMRIERIAEIDLRQRDLARMRAGLRSDGRIDVLEAALGVGAVLLQHVAIALV